jgi:hypothetical protein
MQLDASKDMALVLSLKKAPETARAEASSAGPSTRSPSAKEKKAGRWRHGVDAASGFVKRHFGTGGP